MHILLLDMDGVLLEPRGYHRALQKTVKVWGSALGFGEVNLPMEAIYRFESVGLTSEWESASVCVALMLIDRWKRDPELQLPESPAMHASNNHNFPADLWDDFLNKLETSIPAGELLQRVEHLLLEGLQQAEHGDTVGSLIRNARYFESSPIHRTQQEFVLGSDQMNSIYAVEPTFAEAGTLVSDDKPMLSNADREALLSWLKDPERRAVAFTNRPCAPPEGFFDTPEAEMGLHAAGLQDLEVIGSGTMGWLSAREGKPLFYFLKPSPVHALAALFKAAGIGTVDALDEARALERSRFDGSHPALQGARVDVFEDSTNGLESAQAAKMLLAQAGVEIELNLHGISINEMKKAALQAAGARVFDRLGDALRTIPGFDDL